MTTFDLASLKRRGLSILRLTAAEWAELEETRRRGERFSLVFPHSIAHAGRAQTPVVIEIGAGHGRSGGPAAPSRLKLGWVKSIQAIATRDSRVAFDHIQAVEPATLAELAGETLPSRLKASAVSLLTARATFANVSPKLGAWLIDKLAERPANATALQRLIAMVERPRRFHNAVALQQDALTLALKAFGAPDAEAAALSIGTGTTALAGVRLQEDVVIQHDARWIPGWRLDASDLSGTAVFRRREDELQVFTANKQPLEELFGVDLIYLNETRRAIVMVQYKMMDPLLPRRTTSVEYGLGPIKQRQEPEWAVRIDDQFRVEVSRMDQFNASSASPGPYRMEPSPFFFKLVRRDAATASPAILMSLAHLKQLVAEGALTGPRGGLRIAYGALGGHYLRGEAFVDLIQSGYIGTHSATTDHLETLIRATLAGGKAVVVAIQRALPDAAEWRGRETDEDPAGLSGAEPSLT